MIATADIEAPTVAIGGGLFQVWIDLNCGQGEVDWWWNSAPQKLFPALEEAQKIRAKGWICAVLADGHNPRPDGRWDNPC